MSTLNLPPSGRSRTSRRFRLPISTRRWLGAVVPALTAPFAHASLTGDGMFDAMWAIGLTLVAALSASHAKRGPLLFGASTVVLIAPISGYLAMAAGLVSVVAVAISTAHLRRQAPFARGLGGGAAIVSALASTGEVRPVLGVTMWVILALCVGLSGVLHLPGDRRWLAWVVGVGVTCCLGASALAGAGALTARAEVEGGMADLRLGLIAARAGDVATAQQRLESAHVRLEVAARRIRRFGAVARAVPVVGQNVAALEALLSGSGRVAGQAALTAGATDDDVLAVRTGRLDLAGMAALQHPLRRLAVALEDLTADIDDRLGDPLVPPLQDWLRNVRPDVGQASKDAAAAADAVKVVPTLLGGDGTAKRYLVLFTSPAEARGRFGFPGAFAEVVFTDGRFELGEHGSTSQRFHGLRGDQASFDLAADLLRPYVPFGVTRQVLSVTIPPDFPTVARTAAELWRQSGRAPVDGVLRMDPAALAGLMLLTGPVVVPDVPQPLTALNVERFLVIDQYLQFPSDQAPRRELLDTVADVTFRRLETADLPSPRYLVDLFGPLVRADHMQLTSNDGDASTFLGRIGLLGEFQVPESDSLLVTNVNSTGNKIDTFLDRAVRYDAEVRGEHLSGRVTVDLHNRAPSSGLPFYVIGSSTSPPLPLGTNRSTLFVYTAVPASRIAVDGRPITGRPLRTGGRWLYQALIVLPPGGRSTVTLDLDGDLPLGGYALVLGPGGGVTPDQYTVRVDVDGRRINADGPIAGAVALR